MRLFTAVIALVWLGLLRGPGSQAAGQQDLPVSGRAVPGMEACDRAMREIMAKWKLPGGSLAVAHDGKIVFARGYGWAEVETKTPVRPETRFRIASVSKPITAVAVLRLVQRGKVRLDDRILPLLGDLAPPEGKADPRLQRITVRNLLQHTGGWDPAKSDDPQFLTPSEAKAVALPLPTPPQRIVRYWLTRPLDNDPGSRYAYSNFGYNVLGRIIEKVSGRSYEEFVKREVLAPADIREMRIGGTLKSERAKGEAVYYPQPGAELSDSVFPGEEKVPQAYGRWYQPALDAHGGWIAAASDLVRFAEAIEGHSKQPRLLSPEMVEQMETVSRPPGFPAGGRSIGLAWILTPNPAGGVDWDHAGALENCCASLLLRGADGVSFAVVFNTLPKEYSTFLPELDTALRKATKRT